MLRSYEAKIPGTRYICYLERDQDQWFLRLKLMGHLEAEIPLPHLTKRNISEGVGSLLAQTNQEVNEFIKNNITKELTRQLGPLLNSEGLKEKQIKSGEEVGDVITAIINKLEALEERVEKLEKKLSETD